MICIQSLIPTAEPRHPTMLGIGLEQSLNAMAALSASNRNVLRAVRQAWGALFVQLLVHVGLQHIHAPWPGIIVALLSLHHQHSRQLPLSFLLSAPQPTCDNRN